MHVQLIKPRAFDAMEGEYYFLLYFIVFHQIVNRCNKKKSVNKRVSVIYNYNFLEGL